MKLGRLKMQNKNAFLYCQDNGFKLKLDTLLSLTVH